MKSNFKKRLCAKKLEYDKWCVTEFDTEYNHDISPSQAHHFRCNRKLTEHAKRSFRLYDEVEIPISKSFNTLVFECRGHEKHDF